MKDLGEGEPLLLSPNFAEPNLIHSAYQVARLRGVTRGGFLYAGMRFGSAKFFVFLEGIFWSMCGFALCNKFIPPQTQKTSPQDPRHHKSETNLRSCNGGGLVGKFGVGQGGLEGRETPPKGVSLHLQGLSFPLPLNSFPDKRLRFGNRTGSADDRNAVAILKEIKNLIEL